MGNSIPNTTVAPVLSREPPLERSRPLPIQFRHLSHFPVLAKVAKGPIRQHPNDRITHFLKSCSGQASCIADFLSVRDRLAFLQTHKVQLPPKLLRPLFFSGPSRELDFLYCPVHHMASMGASDAKSPSLHQYLQLEIRYRGSFLSRAVPLRLVAHALHRVIRSWLKNGLQKRGFAAIMAMVNKLLAVFRPTEEVWHAVVNYCAEDGTTLLTYAVAADVPLPTVKKLLEIPCFDLGLPDVKYRLNPIQLAHRLGRDDLLNYFASLVVF